jgi:HEPN domain-containing protein
MALLRGDLQVLAETRAREATALLRAGLHDGAYYLAGYAVECALKACIAKKTRLHEFPDKDRVKAAWTHNLQQLLAAAELSPEFDRQRAANAGFEVSWSVVKDWSEEARYETRTPQEAQSLITAVTDPKIGVLEWLRLYW